MKTQVLRQRLREKRASITPQYRNLYSQLAASHALELLIKLQVRRIGSFFSMPEEIDTSYINQMLLARHNDLYIPYVSGKNCPLEWVLFSLKSSMSRDAVNMIVPQYERKLTLSANKLEAVITPLVGFDKIGNRLGMGGGYYDRSFSFKSRGEKPYLLGFAYASQLAEQLPVQAWDVPLDAVITEQDIVIFNINH